MKAPHLVSCLVGGLAFAQPILAQGVGSFLDGVFPSTRPGTDPSASWTIQNALPNVTFVEPLRVVPHPNGTQLVVGSKDGTLWLVDDTPGATGKTAFLSIGVQYPQVGEGGISGFAFHPEFGTPGHPQRGSIYVWYRWAPTPGQANFNTPGYDRLSRFTVQDGASVADPASEVVLIQQFDRDQFHIGGDLQFGLDGYLYVPVGDEGNSYPRFQSTQRIEAGFFGGMLRIDVDQDPSRSHSIRRQPTNVGTPPAGWPNSFSQGYGIPNDNPWQDPNGSILEEFYAIGLRHPWSMQLDPQSGFMWVGDVGQASFEEINKIELGGNYQWAYKEGEGPGILGTPSNLIGFERGPVWSYGREVGQCLISGGVYRGGLYPELFGHAIAYDFLAGAFWKIDPQPNPVQVTQLGVLPSGYSNGLSSIRIHPDGRILACQSGGGLSPNGKIVEIRRVGTGGPEPPTVLSQTGFFTDLGTLATHPGARAYEPITPFWSDATSKDRWFVLPNDGVHDQPHEQITVDDDGVWEFPVGSVLVKHIEKVLDEVNPSTTKRLETRFFVHATDGWYGVTYRWRADGSDADLLTGGDTETFTVQTDAGSIAQTWTYPSRLECLQCHNANSGAVLGIKTGQLNADVDDGFGGLVNQLELFDSLGMFDTSFSGVDPVLEPRFAAIDDPFRSRSDRVRSWLDANCASCHQPGGVIGEFDARFTTPLCEQDLLFGNVQSSLGLSGAAVVMPGEPDRSLAHVRIAAIGAQAMPPLAKARVDEEFIELFEEWILGLEEEIVVGNDTTTDAPYLDEHQAALRVNEGDVYQHPLGEVEFVYPTEVRFYARRLGNPITPFIARLDGEDDMTILAIGDTRTAGEYQVGPNVFPFVDQFTPSLPIEPGEKLVTGFVDAFADGSGWGAGSVIPADVDFDADEVWELHANPLIQSVESFDPGRDVALLVDNQRPVDTNVGRGLGIHAGNRKSYRFAVVLRSGCAPGEEGFNEFEPLAPLGGEADTDRAHLDAWTSNLVVLDGERYRNLTHGTESVRVDRVEFYARTVADPVTPFVARRDAFGDYTVLAIGTTRTTYSVGPNSFAFDDAGAPVLSLASGETVVIGYLDAFADGSGGGAGAVIPADMGQGEPVWLTGGPSGSDSGSIALASSIIPGSSTITDQTRETSFSVELVRLDEQGLGLESFDSQGTSQDVWVSNLIVNSTDVWVNDSVFDRKIRIDTFRFHAAAQADPVTPFVVTFGDDATGEVLAVGTTRTSYATGDNAFAFDDAGAPEVLLRAGQQIAAGFLDAYADGTGGALGSPIPFRTNPERFVFGTGGPTATGSGSVTVGATLVEGAFTFENQPREYLFGIDVTGMEFLPADCDGDGVVDSAEPDCDGDGIPDDCELEPDCDGNGIPDSCDEVAGRLGRWTSFGMGTAGTGGYVPTLRFSGCIETGVNFELLAENGLGGSLGYLVMSGVQVSIPLFAGQLYVAPPFLFAKPHVLTAGGAGEGTWTDIARLDYLAGVPGEQYFLQALYLDPEGPSGVTWTHALRIQPAWQ